MNPPIPTPEEWLAADPDPVTRLELEFLLKTGDQDGIAARFGDRLRFGTAGMRGPMGVGPNRMNRVVVRQFAAALAEWLPENAEVVIGCDARNNSDVFANEVAAVLAAAGCRPMLLPPRLPTPVLAFAVTDLGARAGVMATASHNPAGDNGLKLYMADGAQVVPPHDRAIEAAMAAQPLPPRDLPPPFPSPKQSDNTDASASLADPKRVDGPDNTDASASLADPKRVDAPDSTDGVVDRYLAAISSNVTTRGRGFYPVAYTPLQGVGLPVLRSALGYVIDGPLHVVEDEAEPDPWFRNVFSPNPEDEETLHKAMFVAGQIESESDDSRAARALPIELESDDSRAARALPIEPESDDSRAARALPIELESDDSRAARALPLEPESDDSRAARALPLALATDPDADRMAAAIRVSSQQGIVTDSGLVDTGRADPGPAGKKMSVSRHKWRILSGDEIGALLCDWMLETTPGGDERVVAGSIVSGRLVKRVAEARGATYVETLTGFKWIARAADNLGPRADGKQWKLVFGYEEALGFACNDRVRDKDGISAALHFVAMCKSPLLTPIGRLDGLMAEFGLHRTDQIVVELEDCAASEVMDAIRAAPPPRFGDAEVVGTTDYRDGVGGLHPADVLRFDLADGGRVSLRPSGTEPLIKFYMEVVGDIGDPDPMTVLYDAVWDLIDDLF